MPKFSDRIGVTKPRDAFQLHEVDDALRNSIWNLLGDAFKEPARWRYAAARLVADFWKTPTDDLNLTSDSAAQREIRARYDSLEWYQVYNLIEHIVEHSEKLKLISADIVASAFNRILERESSAYRFIGNELVPISNEIEVAEINTALETAATRGMQGVSIHLGRALRMLGQKPEPDYRNSIKESISAVEAAAKLIDGSKGGGLAGPLNRLASATEMHGALKDAFLKLYGFTSDEHGIRHALLEAPNIGYHEAKFILVACSAFANFLIGRADEAGLLSRPRAG